MFLFPRKVFTGKDRAEVKARALHAAAATAMAQIPASSRVAQYCQVVAPEHRVSCDP